VEVKADLVVEQYLDKSYLARSLVDLHHSLTVVVAFLTDHLHKVGAMRDTAFLKY
jgi:hypothetical protein